MFNNKYTNTMKKIIPIIGLLAVLLMLSSCISYPNERAYTASCVREQVNFPNTFKVISFDFVASESALTQARTQLDYFNSRIEWDRSSVERYSTWVEECRHNRYDDITTEHAENNLAEARKEFEKDALMIKQLEALIIEYNKNPGLSVLSKAPDAKIYELVYETADPGGDKASGIAYSRFNDKGELVGIKIGSQSWQTLGQFFTIPGYYDWL